MVEVRSKTASVLLPVACGGWEVGSPSLLEPSAGMA